MVSVIVPVYNEDKSITDCLSSLAKQSYKPHEIIVVDDGSTDKSSENIRKLKIKNLKFYSQLHLGPALARNLGANHASGEILVFVDADMVFSKDYILNLVKPIEKGNAKGTFSKDEYLLNRNNDWSVLWNINRYLLNKWKLDKQAFYRVLPIKYQDKQPVFRAILKEEFNKVKGYDNTGYADDWTLSRKLGYQAQLATGAIFYHKNPETVAEIWNQARWIGGNQFLTGSITRKIYNLLKYSFPVSVISGIYVSLKMRRPNFVSFKLLYDLAIFVSVVSSFVTTITKK